MNGESDKQNVYQMFIKHVIKEAREASDKLLGSFLMRRRFQGKYVRVHILFVSETETMDVEEEIETWFRIYIWIRDKTDELLSIYDEEEEKAMIILFPRFINLEEYELLSSTNKVMLKKRLIAWYDS